MTHDFRLEAHTYSVPNEVFQVIADVANDPESTLREKLLARSLFSVAKTLNDMVASLDTGTVVLRVFDSNIVHDPNSDPKKRLG